VTVPSGHGTGSEQYAYDAMNRRPELSLIAPSASPEEAAAVAAALAQFMRQTAPILVAAGPEVSAWRLAALREGVAKPAAAHLPWD
jgi:hypothetical protein